MIKVNFHNLGDFDKGFEVYAGESEDGLSETAIHDPQAWFKAWDLKKCKKAILKKMHKQTGKEYVEAAW